MINVTHSFDGGEVTGSRSLFQAVAFSLDLLNPRDLPDWTVIGILIGRHWMH